MQIVTFFSAPPAALAFLLAPFSLSDVSLRLFRYSLELVLAVAHFFSRFSGEVAGTDRPIPETSLILASAALGAFIALNGRLRQVMGGGLLAAALGAWMRSPRLVAHWSPSGDLFLARPSGEIVRVHLLKGGGLAPLRFSEVDDATCADTNCEFETASGLAIQVHNADPLSVCFAATVAPTAASGTPGQPSDSRDKLCWTGSDISEQGARTPYLDGRALKEEDAISCGPRPWNGCAPT